MAWIDMSDYPPAARRYWFTVVIVGYAALAYALAKVAALPAASQQGIALTALAAGLVGLFPVHVPAKGVKISIEGGDIFVFLALLVYGTPAAMITAAAEAFAGAMRGSKRATSRIGSPGQPCISLLLATSWLPLARSAFDKPDALAPILLQLFGVAACYFALSTTLIRTTFALKQRERVTPLAWLRSYGWYGMSLAASASLAAILYTSERHLGIESILFAAPLVAMFVGSLHFYFEKKKADERHVAELMESERRLQEALGVAEAASRAKTRFLAAASHDLRQPLHALSFLTAALEMRPLDPASREIMRKMTGALEDLSAEFDALLDISKLDAGLVPIDASTFEVEPFLRRLAEPFLPIAQERGLLFEISGDSGVFVRTDRRLLERILRNLVDNALKYTKAGSVCVACHARQGRCLIEVRDSGIGIPQAEQQRVFEEFYQLGNPERDRRKGMGLGLSIVRRLASLLEITLAMDSREGRGSAFSLEIATVAAPAAREERAPAASGELRERQVLLLDDEVGARDALAGYLESLGCKVSAAGTIAEAAALAMLEEPDIVLADYRLRREETGLQAITRLRESRPGLPAIIVTGDTAPERLAELDGTGIEVLHKPVVPARLVESMIAQLTRATADA